MGVEDVALASMHSISKGFYGECGRRGGYTEFVGFGKDVLAELYKLASINLCSNVNGQICTALMMQPPKARLRRAPPPPRDVDVAVLAAMPGSLPSRRAGSAERAAQCTCRRAPQGQDARLAQLEGSLHPVQPDARSRPGRAGGRAVARAVREGTRGAAGVAQAARRKAARRAERAAGRVVQPARGRAVCDAAHPPAARRHRGRAPPSPVRAGGAGPCRRRRRGGGALHVVEGHVLLVTCSGKAGKGSDRGPAVRACRRQCQRTPLGQAAEEAGGAPPMVRLCADPPRAHLSAALGAGMLAWACRESARAEPARGGRAGRQGGRQGAGRLLLHADAGGDRHRHRARLRLQAGARRPPPAAHPLACIQGCRVRPCGGGRAHGAANEIRSLVVHPDRFSSCAVSGAAG